MVSVILTRFCGPSGSDCRLGVLSKCRSLRGAEDVPIRCSPGSRVANAAKTQALSASRSAAANTSSYMGISFPLSPTARPTSGSRSIRSFHAAPTSVFAGVTAIDAFVVEPATKNEPLFGLWP